MLNIDSMIKDAMSQGKTKDLAVFKEIKAKFLNYEKSVEGVKKPIDESIQISLINKIKKEHEETLGFLTPDRTSEIESENFFIHTLTGLLPKDATPEEIKEEAKKIVIAGDKKCMGMYIKTLKQKFPTADGKVISDIVKELLN